MRKLLAFVLLLVVTVGVSVDAQTQTVFDALLATPYVCDPIRPVCPPPPR